MQAADTPETRPDLVLTPTTEEGRSLTVVHDPVSGRYFRIREVEGHILSLLDGATPLDAVHEAVLREFPGARLSQQAVVAFAERLVQLGWLVGSAAAARPRRRQALFRRLLRIKLPPIPADGMFRFLLPGVRFLYRPLPLILAALTILFVGYWAFFSLDELARYPWRFDTPGAWAAILLGIVVMGFIHEMGHGVTCTYFGARSNGVGFFVMYGLPCFYCDVSGAWTLSSRRERMLIGWAGLGWQFAAGAVAFVLWKALEPYSFPARVCHVVLGTCGLTALLNLNPFIKLDGYYLLSDWWRIPNLRDKAMLYLRQRTAATFLGSKAPALGTSRERRIFFWFGLASSIYSAVLLFFVARKLGGWLLHLTHGFGLLVIGALVMFSVFSWLQNAFSGLRSRPAGPASGGKAPAPPSPEGPAPTEPSARKPGFAIRPNYRLLATMACLMVGLWAFWHAKWTLFVGGPCTLEAAQRVAVRPMVEGVLQEVRYREGDRVASGATLGMLESYDLQADREQLQQRLATTEAASHVIEQQAPIMETENARDVEQARRELQTAKRELEDREQLFPARRSESERKVQEARAALDGAEKIAERDRADERSVAVGQLTPSMQSIQERIAKIQTQRSLAQKEVQRVVYLVSQGAIQRQKLDTANTELASLAREESSLCSDLDAARKDLRERREDAEAEVAKRRATYEAALEAQRVVGEETRPDKLDAQMEEVRSRAAVLATTQQLRQSADIKRAEAAVKRMEARPVVTQIQRVEKKLRQTRVTAPMAGVISTPRLEEKQGKKFDKGETIAWIDRIDTLKAKISVDEKEIGEVRPGLPVQLKVGAYPDRLFEGRVLEVSPRTTAGGGHGSYEVRMRIENPNGDLRPGITGYTKILCGKRPLPEVAFRRVNRYVRTEVWSWF